MTPERRDFILAKMEEMKADLEADAERMEGVPFTGPNVARALGELGGTLHAFIGAVQAYIRESDLEP